MSPSDIDDELESLKRDQFTSLHQSLVSRSVSTLFVHSFILGKFGRSLGSDPFLLDLIEERREKRRDSVDERLSRMGR